MKEKPILFSTPMVQEILEDRKGATRRIAKAGKEPIPTDWTHIPEQSNLIYAKFRNPSGLIIPVKKPYMAPGVTTGQVNTVLWVRETWCERLGDISRGRYIYKAHKEPLTEMQQYALNQNIWKPSIFMPKAAARLWLEVLDVYPERLQDITDAESRAEGAVPANIDVLCRGAGITYFAKLWDGLNAKRGFGWASNPWVWVIKFRRIDNE